jgi:ABC-type antimicrobial peptide transport system permease subunit
MFVLVVVIMVCGKMLIKEQQDYGIYKALGFTSTNLRLQFAFRFLVVAIGGSILGMIANLLWSDKMMSALLWNVGITSYKSNNSVLAVFVPSILISLSFFVFAFLMAGKIKRVDTKNLIVE